jgi:heptosyltransferase III
VHFYIKILNKFKIIIIIQRSNGDVFLSSSLIRALYEKYDSPSIDLLVNDDTYDVAKLLPHINLIHTFSYIKKASNRWLQEKELILNLFRKYDLSINLTSSDRSVAYALISSKKSISVVEKMFKKSWWKRKFLTNYYFYDSNQHILIQNLTPLSLLNINYDLIQHSVDINKDTLKIVGNKLNSRGINNFIIFHPSAQYKYKIYPEKQRNQLISYLSRLGIPIIVTGANNAIDLEIKKSLPNNNNIFDFIGETSLEEYFALSSLCEAYVGMDTLNMHIASSQNKRIFAIFGPTKLNMWSPWSNFLKTATTLNKPVQTYGKNTIFQSSSPCKYCGLVGCGDIHGKNEFMFDISPEDIFKEISQWHETKKL